MAATAKSILSSFELTETKKTNCVDKITHRRNKIISKIEEQILAVQAILSGTEYLTDKTIRSTDDGNEIKSIVKKHIKKWFYTDDNNEWYLEVKYGNRALQLAANKTSIVVGAFENMNAVFDKVKQAVLIGELDKAVDELYKKKKQNN